MTLERLPRYAQADYQPIAPRANVKRTQPSLRGWGEPCDTANQVKVTMAPRPRDGKVFNRPFRKELAPLFKFLVDATHELGALTGFEIRTNDEPDGGFSTYACRPIRDSTSYSWHSWPVAVDINSSGNPLRYDGGFESRQPPWMVDLWESAGWYWGGRYVSGRVDAMHFEYLRSPADVATDLANAQAAYERIKLVLAPPPPPVPEVPDPAEVEKQLAAVKALQAALNEVGVDPPLVVDGIAGPKTLAALDGAKSLLGGT